MCLLFVLCKSDHFWQRYCQFHKWPWKFKVKVMAKLKPDGHNWGLDINWYVCFLFRGNCIIFGWDITNSIFDLENWRSRSWPRSTQWSHLRPRVQSMCLLFFSWQSDYFWPYLTLKIQGQDHNENQPKSNQVIYRSGPTILPKIKEIQKIVQKLSHEQESAADGCSVRTGTKTSSHPQYTGVT